DLSDPLVKKREMKIILEDVGKLKDPIERDHWLQIIAADFSIDPKALDLSLVKNLSTREKEPDTAEVVSPVFSKNDQISQLILGIFIENEKFRNDISAEVSPEAVSPKFRSLYTELKKLYHANLSNSSPGGTPVSLTARGLYDWLHESNRLNESERSLFTEAAFQASKLLSEIPTGELKAEVMRLVKELTGEHKKQRLTEIENALRKAEGLGKQEEVQALVKEFQELMSS
ncbi:MAG: hypothetical protein V1821_00475, partial [bacterium]